MVPQKDLRRPLTLLWRRPLSYRNWFLYDNGLRHERVKLIFSLRPGLRRKGLIILWHFLNIYKMMWKLMGLNSVVFLSFCCPKANFGPMKTGPTLLPESVFVWQKWYHFIFLLLFKVWSVLHHGSNWGEFKIKKQLHIFIYFFGIFVCFS